MFLLLAPTTVGLGQATSTFLASRDKPREEAPFQAQAGKLSDLTLDQAGIALQMFEVTKGQSLFDLGKQAIGGKKQTPQGKEVAAKLHQLLTPGREGTGAYSGEGTQFNEPKGKVTIGKSNVELLAKQILSEGKAEIKQLKSQDAITNTALEASVKAQQSLGLFYTSVFQAKNLQARAKAATKNLDSAIKALKVIKPTNKKAGLTQEQRAYLISNLAIVQALANKSGSAITQQVLLTELKRLADGTQPGTVDELAKDLVIKAEQAAGKQEAPAGGQQGPPPAPPRK